MKQQPDPWDDLYDVRRLQKALALGMGLVASFVIIATIVVVLVVR